MHNWRRQLKYDPMPAFLAAPNVSLAYLTRRDLLEEDPGPVEKVWETPAVKKLLRRQLDDGAWPYPGGGKPHLRSSEDYNQIETFRILGELVEKHALNRRHPAIRRAAEFLFAHQTKEGDFRGIYGNQYSPNYSAGIMELLIKAGYERDRRIRKGLRWLLSMRQDDGGWAIPLRTVLTKFNARTLKGETIQPDRLKPFSHLATGVVLRAFAAHPEYRHRPEIHAAAELLASRFFKRDTYPDRGTVSYWTSFSFPFWFTDLLSALDSVSLIGISERNPKVAEALKWFAAEQGKTGVWSLYILRGTGEKDRDLWISYAVCRLFKRFYGVSA